MIIDEDYLDYHMSREDLDSSNNQNKYWKRPKLKISRLSEEKKIVPLEIDIEINEKFILRERFDWNLEDSNISPSQFADLFIDEIGVPEHNKESIKKQIWTQIIDHIEKNTTANATLQKQKSGRYTDYRESYSFDVPTNMETEEERAKQTERQKVIGEMRRKSYSLSKNSNYLDTKKICNYCENSQIIASTTCRSCKMPYKITDHMPKMGEREKLAINLLELFMKQIDVVAEADLDLLLDVEDFASTYYFKNALITKFANNEEVIANNIYQPIAQAIQCIYEEFIQEHTQKNPEEDQISQNQTETNPKETPKPINDNETEKDNNSDLDRDANEEDDEKDEDGSPKKQDPIKKSIRKRGRPKKVIIPKRFSLLRREKIESI